MLAVDFAGVHRLSGVVLPRRISTVLLLQGTLLGMGVRGAKRASIRSQPFVKHVDIHRVHLLRGLAAFHMIFIVRIQAIANGVSLNLLICPILRLMVDAVSGFGSL